MGYRVKRGSGYPGECLIFFKDILVKAILVFIKVDLKK